MKSGSLAREHFESLEIETVQFVPDEFNPLCLTEPLSEALHNCSHDDSGNSDNCHWQCVRLKVGEEFFSRTELTELIRPVSELDSAVVLAPFVVEWTVFGSPVSNPDTVRSQGNTMRRNIHRSKDSEVMLQLVPTLVTSVCRTGWIVRHKESVDHTECSTLASASRHCFDKARSERRVTESSVRETLDKGPQL